MDIVQLKYFVTIVETDFNLSSAANKLNISQPALTKLIRKFENDENIKLFVRVNGRLKSLTLSGELFYANAKTVISHYDRMMSELRENSTSIRGKIRIGVPPLILTVLFSNILSKLIIDNPNIYFDIVEVGAYELERSLKLQEIDLAIILQPTNLNPHHFIEEVIYTDELSCFMSANHPLADKKHLTFYELENQNLAIFNETFMIHHQLVSKFQSLSIKPKIALTSVSWNFLIESTLNSDFITIMPRPINRYFSNKKIKEVIIKDSIPWKVAVAYPKKCNYSRIELFVRDSLVEYFECGYDNQNNK